MTVPVLQVKNLYKLFIPLEHSQNEKKGYDHAGARCFPH